MVRHGRGQRGRRAGALPPQQYVWEEGGKKKTLGTSLEIKAVAWDEACVAARTWTWCWWTDRRRLDAARRRCPGSSPRAVSKLRKQASRWSPEREQGGAYFGGEHPRGPRLHHRPQRSPSRSSRSCSASRRATPPLRGPVLDRIRPPARRDARPDIEVVEIIGGAARVPFIKQALSTPRRARAGSHPDADPGGGQYDSSWARANMGVVYRTQRATGRQVAGAMSGEALRGHDAAKPGERGPCCPCTSASLVRRIVSIPNATEDRAFTVYHKFVDGTPLKDPRIRRWRSSTSPA